MSRIHVLGGVNGVYSVIVHELTPGGNNSAGVLWSTVLVNSGRAVTVMSPGLGPGQIDPAEKAQIEAGTVMEGVFSYGDNPNLTPAQRNIDLDTRATQLIMALQARLADELRYFGATRN